MKKLFLILIVVLSLFFLVGCQDDPIYRIEWHSLEVMPERPLVNERVRITVNAGMYTSTDFSVILHWVITDENTGEQKEYQSESTSIFAVFTTPGKKDVLIWAETYNNPYEFHAHPFNAQFEVFTE